VPALADALDDWVLDGKPVDSVLEPAMRPPARAHRLPPAEFHPIIGGYEVDFWIVDSPLVLECDGWSTHGRDRISSSGTARGTPSWPRIGFVVLRFTPTGAIVKRPVREAERIRRNPSGDGRRTLLAARLTGWAA
jgi:very-short-patch-repair endonuclease